MIISTLYLPRSSDQVVCGHRNQNLKKQVGSEAAHQRGQNCRRSLHEHTQDRSKWMVMGPGRLLSSAFSNVGSVHNLTLLYCIIIVLLLNMAVSVSASCRTEDCINSRKRAMKRIDRAQQNNPDDQDSNLRNRMCKALRRNHRCLRKMHKACRGNLLFHSMEHLNRRDVVKHNCPRKGKPSSSRLHPVTERSSDPAAPTINTTTTTSVFPEYDDPTEGSECTYTGKSEYKHCGMFGDPHLRTFSDEFYTCNVKQTWPLIDNDHMVVMATNDPVKEGSSATITTKITVLIKAAGKCSGQRHYVASSKEGLSSAFNDGSTSSGSVSIVEVVPKRHVEIQARFLGTTVIIRQVGRHLTFAIRMPEEYTSGLGSHKQLCVQGCPVLHRIVLSAEEQKAKPDDTTISNRPKTNAKKKKAGKSQSQTTSDDNLSLPSEDTATELLHFTEKEARMKCKTIILAAATVQQESELRVPSKEGASTHLSDSLSSSQSSHVFSSLVPSSHKNSRPSKRKHNRMAAAAKSEDSSLSFRRLRSSIIDPDLKSKHLTGNRGKKKNKRDALESSADHTKNERVSCKEKRKEKSRLVNFYFESCVFDLKTTGDVNFTLAASAALQDVRRTHALRDSAPGTSLEVVRLWEPIETGIIDCPDDTPVATTTNKDGGKGSAVRSPPFTLTMLICVFASVIYLNCAPWMLFSFQCSADKLYIQHSEIPFYKSASRPRTFSATMVTT